MAVQISNKADAFGGINMTPMIDCVFLLLIFFLVATKFEEAERDMSVKLPQASEAMPMTARPKELFINVTGEGRYKIAGLELSSEQVLAALRQAYANNPGKQVVIIRADRRCAWEYVMEVMNQCNKANIRDYRVTALDPSQG